MMITPVTVRVLESKKLIEIRFGAGSEPEPAAHYATGIIHVHHVETPLTNRVLIVDGYAFLLQTGRSERVVRSETIETGAHEIESVEAAIEMARTLEQELLAWAEQAHTKAVMAGNRDAN